MKRDRILTSCVETQSAINGKIKPSFSFFIAILLFLFTTISSIAQSTKKPAIVQPTLGYRTVKIITVDGLKFKDLNKNGQLDKYEDWRLPASVRSNDLLSKMSLEEKVGFMLISTSRLKNDWSFDSARTKEPITSDFNEEDLVANMNMFTRKQLPTPVMNAAGTTKGVTQFHLRHFILRANVSAKMTA